MKYLLFIIAMCPFFVYAQDTDSTTISEDGETHAVYAELLGWNTNVLGIGKKAKVEVDFGEESWGWRGNDGRDLLVDENGKQIKFNSMVDAINYMGERGWKFEASYVVTVAGQNVIHWLMSKQIRQGESARDGIRQLRDVKKERQAEKERQKKKGKAYDDPLY